MATNFSHYQQAAFTWLEDNAGNHQHMVLNGVAGCGKTTTGMELFRIAKRLERSGCYIAFNKDIQVSTSAKMPPGFGCFTYHAHGMAGIRKTYGGVNLNENKILDYIKGRRDFFKLKFLQHKIKKLVGLCKINGIITPDDEVLLFLSLEAELDFADQEGTEISRQMRLAFPVVREAISYSIDNPTTIDFDDMIFLPYALPEEISLPRYDLLVIDELQDTSPVQMELALRSINDGGNIIGIGDPFQSIYAFRGAGATSFQDFKTGTNATELPLSLCYRCPTDVRDLVNRKFPYIRFETPEWAKRGAVLSQNKKQAAEQMGNGDLALCRVNKDLIEMAFELIRAGKRATVKGRDIGKGITNLLNKSNAGTTKEFLDWLQGWYEAELDKAARIESEGKRQNIIDRYETIQVLSEGTQAVDEIAARCDALFADSERAGVMLSSVHRAKGLEAENVYIISPELMPHPAAWKPVDIDQERNIEYVAITRSMNNLIYIRDEKEKETLPAPQMALPEPYNTGTIQDMLSLPEGLQEFDFKQG